MPELQAWPPSKCSWGPAFTQPSPPHPSCCVFSRDNAFILIPHFRKGAPHHLSNRAVGTNRKHTKESILLSGCGKYHAHKDKWEHCGMWSAEVSHKNTLHDIYQKSPLFYVG